MATSPVPGRSFLAALAIRLPFDTPGEEKWTTELDNIRPIDIVLIVADDSPRCRWPLGRVLQVQPSDDGSFDGLPSSPRTERTTDPCRSWCGCSLRRRIPSDLYDLTLPDTRVRCRCDLSAPGSARLFELANQLTWSGRYLCGIPGADRSVPDDI